MNRDEILLTPKEGEKSYEDGWQKARAKGLSFGECCRAGDKSQYAAQCLKLLDVLKKPCKHGQRANASGMTGEWRLVDCPKCNAEIERLIKEG